MSIRSKSIRPNMARLLIPMLAVGLLLPLSGCEKAAEKVTEAALEKATGNKVELERDGSAMTIKTDQGDMKMAASVEGESVPMPEDFPQDVFLPETGKINSAMDMAGMKMVNIISSAPSSELSAQVQKGMEAKGWKREMAMQGEEGSATFIYSKDKRQTVYQIMKNDDGGSQIAIRSGGEG